MLRPYLFMCFVLQAFLHAAGMMSKRTNPFEKLQEDIPTAKRARHNIADLFLSNDISGARAQSVFDDCDKAGAKFMQDLAKAGSSGKHPQNSSRDLLRKLLKNSQWPPVYLVPTRLWDNRQMKEIIVDVAVFLPHELVQVIAQFSKLDLLMDSQGMHTDAMTHLREIEAKVQCSLLPVCMWGDGVPFNWDRTQSLDVFSISFPGWVKAKKQNLRLPVAALPHRAVVKHNTYDDIMSVMAWSFRSLAAGVFPPKMHNGQEFKEPFRQKLSGTKMQARGILVMVKGDWKFFKDCFRFPQFNEKGGCCWKCRATPDSIKEVGAAASWRTQRLTHFEFLASMSARGVAPSPLFGAPFLVTNCFMVDWLHCTDQGVGADFLGNCLRALIDKMPGNNMQERVAALWGHIQNFYAVNECESKYDTMTLLMIQKPNSPPKLRGKAAEVRSLIPFGYQASMRFMNSADPKENSIQQCGFHLMECYNALHRETHSALLLAEHSRKFCLLYVALQDCSEDPLWRCKPKMHLFQEMCEMSTGNPADAWTYRDEEFGGCIASASKRRGGANNPGSLSATVLMRFAANNGIPYLK